MMPSACAIFARHRTSDDEILFNRQRRNRPSDFFPLGLEFDRSEVGKANLLVRLSLSQLVGHVLGRNKDGALQRA